MRLLPCQSGSPVTPEVAGSSPVILARSKPLGNQGLFHFEDAHFNARNGRPPESDPFISGKKRLSLIIVDV